MLVLYSLTAFLGALLLFSIQPLFAKLVLPLLGGAPAVWNTAMLIFQATLLGGYAFAHGIGRLAPRAQAVAHLGVLLLAAFALPLAVPAGWQPPAAVSPLPWLIGTMALTVAPPFFAVAVTAPLIQRWFTRTGHAAAADPYFLYAASNLGSMIGLLGYPTLAEPFLRTGTQASAWTWGYGGLALLIAGCAVVVRSGTVPASASDEPIPAVAWRDRLWWVGLAFAPSSLLLGVTTHVTTDVAAVPLLWVIPLALYLLSFVIVFARRPPLRHDTMVVGQALLLPLVAASFVWPLRNPWIVFPLHLAGFFVTALVCHGELAARRPPARRLTEFYLWMAAGGALGGVFNALAAPLLFTSVAEYPLALVLAAALRPGRRPANRSEWLGDLGWGAGIAAGLAALPLVGLRADEPDAAPVFAVLFGAALVACIVFHGRPVRFALCAAALVGGGAVLFDTEGRTLAAERTFFGVHRVMDDANEGARVLMHGTTIHGAQAKDWEQAGEPLTYYTRQGPLGQIFAAFGAEAYSVGAVGLGAGAAACHRRDGQRWTFFEIDPTVERLARDTRFFTYLADCAPEAQVVLGDARLTLAVTAETFDLLILDAFSSDAIPIHLLTREAMALYRDRLAEGGVIAFHLTNRYMDLRPMVANLAANAGLTARVQDHTPEGDDALPYRAFSRWVVLARDPTRLVRLDRDERWQPLPPAPGQPTWSDDFSNIVAVLAHRGGRGTEP